MLYGVASTFVLQLYNWSSKSFFLYFSAFSIVDAPTLIFSLIPPAPPAPLTGLNDFGAIIDDYDPLFDPL